MEDKCTMRFAQVPQRSGGPWGPQGPHEAPRGIFGPFGAPRAPPGAPGDSGGAPGAPQRLPGHFWKNPDFGLPAAPGLRGGSGLAAAPSGLAASSSRHSRRRTPQNLRHGRILRGLAAAAGLAAAPSPCCLASGCLRRFFPAKNAFFGKQVTCTLKKEVLREGSPEPGTPLDRRGPRFHVQGCAGELEMRV